MWHLINNIQSVCGQKPDPYHRITASLYFTWFISDLCQFKGKISCFLNFQSITVSRFYRYHWIDNCSFFWFSTRSKGSVNLPQGSVNLDVLCYFLKILKFFENFEIFWFFFWNFFENFWKFLKNFWNFFFLIFWNIFLKKNF